MSNVIYSGHPGSPLCYETSWNVRIGKFLAKFAEHNIILSVKKKKKSLYINQL